MIWRSPRAGPGSTRSFWRWRQSRPIAIRDQIGNASGFLHELGSALSACGLDVLQLDARMEPPTAVRLIFHYRVSRVSDGELLSIREIGEPFSPLLFDDVEDVEVAPDRANVAWMTWFVDNQRMIGYLVTGLAVATAAALLLPSHAGDLVLAGTTLGLGVFGVIVACVLALRSGGTTRPQWVSVVATPLLFGGPLYVIPEGFGAKALPMAFGLTALSSLVMLLITGNGRALHTTVITLSALGGASTSAQLLWHLPQRTIGAAVANVSESVVSSSPRVSRAASSGV